MHDVRETVVCPFCNAAFSVPSVSFAQGLDVIGYDASSIECACGATYAPIRGRRPAVSTEEEEDLDARSD